MIGRLRRTDSRALLLGLFSFAFLAALWQVLTATGAVNAFLISSPFRVASALGQQAASGVLVRDLGVSLMELGIGLGLAVVVGITVGTLIGWYRRAEYAVDPFIWLGYSAPFVALYPVFVLLFGLGKSTVIVITFLLSVFPITVNTTRGVKNTDRMLVRAAHSFGASDAQIFRKVALPAAVPLVMAGLRLAVGRALVGVVIGELFSGRAGLGYSVANYGALLRTSDMLASVVVIAALGVLLTRMVGLIERRVDSWRPDEAGT